MATPKKLNPSQKELLNATLKGLPELKDEQIEALYQRYPSYQARIVRKLFAGENSPSTSLLINLRIQSLSEGQISLLIRNSDHSEHCDILQFAKKTKGELKDKLIEAFISVSSSICYICEVMLSQKGKVKICTERLSKLEDVEFYYSDFQILDECAQRFPSFAKFLPKFIKQNSENLQELGSNLRLLLIRYDEETRNELAEMELQSECPSFNVLNEIISMVPDKKEEAIKKGVQRIKNCNEPELYHLEWAIRNSVKTVESICKKMLTKGPSSSGIENRDVLEALSKLDTLKSNSKKLQSLTVSAALEENSFSIRTILETVKNPELVIRACKACLGISTSRGNIVITGLEEEETFYVLCPILEHAPSLDKITFAKIERIIKQKSISRNDIKYLLAVKGKRPELGDRINAIVLSDPTLCLGMLLQKS